MDLPEISGMSKAAVEAAMDLFKKLAGPVFEEFGGLLQDQVKFWRFKNGVRILQKAKRFLDDAGVSPQQVSLKVLISSFGDGSLEEDEAMQDRWASLLANAADPNSEVSVLPSFAEILKELSPKEAAILDTLFIHATPLPPVNAKKPYSVSTVAMGVFKHEVGLSDDELEILINNLSRLGLCLQKMNFTVSSPSGEEERGGLSLTPLGFAFVSACRPPERKR